MNVLIVESQQELGSVWRRHLERKGMNVTLVSDQDSATAHLDSVSTDIIILNLVLREGAALAIADYANYRLPNARVVFVTNTTFFSDGSIFEHAPNARAFVPSDTAPEDLAAMIEHYGAEATSPG